MRDNARSAAVATWGYRVVQMFFILAVGYGVLWVDRDIDIKLRRELSSYLRLDQFDMYKMDQNRLAEQLVQRLDRIENKLDRLVEKQRAAVELMPDDGVVFFTNWSGIHYGPIFH